jgi:hypothetical protein
MMKLKCKMKMAAVVMLAAVIFSACGAAAPAEPTQDPNAIFTQVAETVMVSMTQTSEAMPPTLVPELLATTTPTLAVTPTETIATQPLGPTLPAGPTATIPRVGDSAKWNTQTPADGAVLEPNEDFQFIVCLGNNGTSEWDNTYYLEWVSGYQLWTNQTQFYVGEIIEPGGKWCFYTPAIAPPDPGSYTTRWYMRMGGGDFMHEVYFNYRVEA